MFEKSAKSSFQLSDKSLHPFILQASISKTYSMLLEKVRKTAFNNIVEDKDYWELYVQYEDYEITFYLIDEKNGNTRVVMLIYTPHHRGKAKKLLREYINTYKNEFEPYLCKHVYNQPSNYGYSN